MTLLQYILKQANAVPPPMPAPSQAPPPVAAASPRPAVNQPAIHSSPTVQAPNYGGKPVDAPPPAGTPGSQYTVAPKGPTVTHAGMVLPTAQAEQMQAAEAQQQMEMAKHAPKQPTGPAAPQETKDQAIVNASMDMMMERMASATPVHPAWSEIDTAKSAASVLTKPPNAYENTATGGHNAGITPINPATNSIFDRNSRSGVYGFQPPPDANIVPPHWAGAGMINQAYGFVRPMLMASLLKGVNEPPIMGALARETWRGTSRNYLAGVPTENTAANPWLNALARSAGTAVNQFTGGNFNVDRAGQWLGDAARNVGASLPAWS